jgi:hypothetical protein
MWRALVIALSRGQAAVGGGSGAGCGVSVGELDVEVALVRRLVAAQFPR